MSAYADDTNRNNSALQALVGTGADSFDNLFDAIIEFPEEISATDDNQSQAMVRCTSEWTPPTSKAKTYKVSYRGVSMERAAPAFEDFKRELECTFRSDAEYGLYDIFMKWKAYSGNVQTGAVATWVNALGTVTLKTLAESFVSGSADDDQSFFNFFEGSDAGNPHALNSSATTREYIFKDVWVKSVEGLKWTSGSADAKEQTFKVVFAFGDIEYPEGWA